MPSRRASSATNACEDNKLPTLKTQNSSKKSSMSNNTLAVPTGTSLVAGEGFACGSCVDLTYGSTFSLGAASATSEYVKDGSDAILSPNVCFGNSSAFMFGSSQVLDPSFKCKDIPWLKVSYFIGKVTN